MQASQEGPYFNLKMHAYLIHKKAKNYREIICMDQPIKCIEERKESNNLGTVGKNVL